MHLKEKRLGNDMARPSLIGCAETVVSAYKEGDQPPRSPERLASLDFLRRFVKQRKSELIGLEVPI